MEERIVTCLGHLYLHLQEFPPLGGMGWGFRGQADASWPILPKAGRKEYYDPTWEAKSIKKGMDRPPKDLGRFHAWRTEAVAFCQDLPTNDFECLAYAQHHGLATRLLDWTHNPLAALYFGVREVPGSDGAVYAFHGDVVIRPEIMPLRDVPEVAVFYPRPVHQRILVQRAFFTIHPEPQIPLEPKEIRRGLRKFTTAKSNLIRFRIPAEAKSMIQIELDDFGVNQVALFPGVDGLSDFINWRTRRAVAVARRKAMQSKL